jgi:DNA-directed RNA polymerase beta subunit
MWLVMWLAMLTYYHRRHTRRGQKSKSMSGGVIRAQIPYIKADIPILILFRALGVVNDKEILEHIVYDFEELEMMEMLRPSIEEAQPIQTQVGVELALLAVLLLFWCCSQAGGITTPAAGRCVAIWMQGPARSAYSP